MILVDDRIGSADLLGHLQHWHVNCELTRLEYGDAAFSGNGPDGPLYVGVEIKKVHDALQCMGDGRFSGRQLPGLVSHYDRVWLALEGPFRPDFSTGLLLAGTERRRELALGSRRFMYRDLDNWCTTMEVRANIRVRRTGDRVETARFIADLHGWWDKDWGEHRSHLSLHEDRPDVALFAKPSLVRTVAAQLPGLGWKKSQAVARRFKTVEAMVIADPEDWEAIDGIGSTMAQRIWTAIHQGQN